MSTYDMKTYELLEFAALDAHGLLDDQEREAFERAFGSASPSLQAQVRREQARLAQSDVGLPPVEPPVGMKSRVMAAVRDAVGIGTSRADSREQVFVGVEQIGVGEMGVGINQQPALRLTPDILPSRGVSHWWRAGAVGAMAAAMVFAFAMLQVRAESEAIAQRMQSNEISQHFLDEFGSRFEQSLFNENTRFVAFSPTAEEFAGRAVVMLDPVRKTGQILVKDLPATGGEYSLVVVDADGNPTGTAIVTFRSTGPGVVDQLFNSSIDQGQNLAIVAPGPGGKARLVLAAKNNS